MQVTEVEVEEIRKQLKSEELDAAALLHGAPALLGEVPALKIDAAKLQR